MPDKEIKIDIKEGYTPSDPPVKPSRRDDSGYVPPKKPAPQQPKKKD